MPLPVCLEIFADLASDLGIFVYWLLWQKLVFDVAQLWLDLAIVIFLSVIDKHFNGSVSDLTVDFLEVFKFEVVYFEIAL